MFLSNTWLLELSSSHTLKLLQEILWEQKLLKYPGDLPKALGICPWCERTGVTFTCGTHPKSHGTLLCLHDVTRPTSEALICSHLGPTWLLESGCPEIPAQGKGSSQALM